MMLSIKKPINVRCIAVCIAVASSVCSLPVSAAMVGDEIHVAQFFPQFGTINNNNSVNIVVAEGGSDKIAFGVMRINANDTAVGQPNDPNVSYINFVVNSSDDKTYSTGAVGPDGGNFFGIEDIDFVGDPGKTIVEVSLIETFGGISAASDVRWGPDSVFVNFAGRTGGNPLDRLVVAVEFGDAGAETVPLPPAVLFLLSGLIGLPLFARRG